ncbi:hypothetical protein HHO41_21515 [Bacillus sp. DNRA2]|uniref:hypothetical protein n=1 Tax=Bacillus sp. DNRA2 TaxID=2723053 RepID=UPI00145CBBD6|nr:hypothetical protein [Bacillus sp. DNRA2]NMD72804.1 hypothetical protein [Bacillus sp. DNRA2]
MNFKDKVWVIKDVSKQYDTAGVLEIEGFSEALEEDTEICTVWTNDVHWQEQLENANLLSLAPEMYRMLKSCHVYFSTNKNDEFMEKKVGELLKDIENIDSMLIFAEDNGE